MDKCTGGNVSLDVTKAPLDRIINDLSNQLGIQIVKLTDPDALVTVKCENVSIETAFNYIFKGTKFAFKKEDGAYIIGSVDSNNLDKTKLN